MVKSNRLMVSPGLKNLNNFFTYSVEFRLFIFYGKYKQGGASNARINKIDPFITYNIKQSDGLVWNLIELDTYDKYKLNHPCFLRLNCWS